MDPEDILLAAVVSALSLTKLIVEGGNEGELEELKGRVSKAEKEAQEREQRMKEEYSRLLAESQRLASEAEAARKAEVERARVALQKAEEARDEAARRLVAGIPPEVRPSPEAVIKFKTQYGYTPGRIHIAVVGESGTGKSTLINGLRGLGPKDEGSAKTGINETTRNVTPYDDPRDSSIVWYDVPGANTPDISDWMYFANMGLFVFDLLIIVYADRFTTTAATLIQNAEKCGLQTILARTKADCLLQSLEDDEGLDGEAAKEALTRSTVKDVHRNLETLDLPKMPVYLVSRKALKKFVVEGDREGTIHEPVLVERIQKEKEWLLG